MTELPEEYSEIEIGDRETFSAVRIEFLAIDKKFQRRQIGTSVLRIIINRTEDLAKNWPIRIITIDARNDLVEWYRRFGFTEMPHNPKSQEGITKKMFRDCLLNSKELEEYLVGQDYG